MDVQRKLVVWSLWLHFIILFNRYILSANGIMELRVPRNDGIAGCVFEDRESCNAAAAQKGMCQWDERSSKCYPNELLASRSRANGVGFSRRQLKEVQVCFDVIYKDQCKALEHCRWCRSKVINDGCFKVLEARRLPTQVFDCSIVS